MPAPSHTPTGVPGDWCQPASHGLARSVTITCKFARGQDLSMSFQTEFAFTLPRGYRDAVGRIHRQGVMTLATALDEIEAVQDPRVQANEAYLPVFLLSRVVKQLGELSAVTPQVIAGLFVIDLAYLEDLYQRINSPTPVTMGAVCPHCSAQFQLEVAPLS